MESRTGINLSQEDLILLDELVSPLILQGHSSYMILQNHPEITLSEKTIYNYMEFGALSVKNIDLPKKMKYKVRTGCPSESVDSAIYEDRTYKDYQAFLKEFPDTGITEMDTVLGCECSRKVLLTLHSDCCSFMMAYLLECGVENLIRTSIYYCDPMCSWQKAHCEKNHEYISKICPKGTSFDDYSQEDIRLMMSHINSSPRQSLGGLSPIS